jgi:hypothetical protein
MHLRQLVVGAFALAATLMLGTAPARAQDERVVRRVPTDMVESILRDMSITYKKTSGKGVNVYFYDYTRNNLKVRLHYHDGKDLMLDALFTTPVTLSSLNEWNVKSRFSRALLLKQGASEVTTLDSNLDCLGGVTQNTIKQFIRVFDQEAKAFHDFIGALEVVEEVYTDVTEQRLERVLNALNIKFNRKAGGVPGVFLYDFVRNGYNLRVTNFKGKDLMIDAVFARTSLDSINKYHLQRNFVRVVLYPGSGKPYTSLESNLDCVGGCSDSILRAWIVIFDTEVATFDKFLKSQ